MPIHGEFFMRASNKELALSLGYTDEQSILADNGSVMELENNSIRMTKETVPSNYILIDGLGVGDIGGQVIMDRQTLAANGILLALIPVDTKTRKLKGEVNIISRGFIYMKESEELIKDMVNLAAESYKTIINKRPDAKRAEIKKYVRGSLDKYIYKKLERYPLILPVIIEK